MTCKAKFECDSRIHRSTWLLASRPWSLAVATMRIFSFSQTSHSRE